MTIARTRENTPLDELHQLLDQASDRVGALERGSTSDTLKLLRMLNRIDALYTELAAADMDLRAEESRRETIGLGLRRKANHVLRLVKPEGGMATLRSKQQPPANAWWWRLDLYVAEERRKTLRRMARTGVVVAVILAIAALIYNTFLQPDPAVIAHMDHISKVQRALEAGDLNAALAAAEAGVEEFPDDGELLLWRAALLKRMQRPTESDAAFAAARATYPDDTTFLINSSTVRLSAGDTDGAYADAKKATTLAPNSAQAFLVLGGTQEIRGEISAASSSYGTAASLAAAEKNTQLEAVAKVRLAMLLQSAPVFSTTPKPSATP